MYPCMCVLWYSVAAVCRHDLFRAHFLHYSKQATSFLYFHVCVLLCSVAAACHHDLFWLLRCFMNYKPTKVFIPMYVCCCALWLLCATMICIGSFFVV